MIQDSLSNVAHQYFVPLWGRLWVPGVCLSSAHMWGAMSQTPRRPGPCLASAHGDGGTALSLTF